MKRICLYCMNFHHKETVYDGLEEVMSGVFVPKEKTIPAHCSIYPTKCKEWWKKNGHLTSDDAEEMDCFDFTEDGKKLNDTIELSKEILADIKKED